MPLERLEHPIPRRAFGLAALSLLVPIAGAFIAPDVADGAETLLWLTALIPAFVLSYYRGWQGSSVALAGGMVALAGTNLAVVSMGTQPPNWHILFGVVTAYVGLTLGIGWLSDGLHRDRRGAQRLAMTDSLTGLANRRFAERMLEQAFALAQRGMELTVVLFDVDHFKDFNDRHGHVAGDQVLRQLGTVLKGVTRRSDLSSRYGGEEFLCILHNCGGGGAMTFVERVLAELAKAELPADGVTLSAGIATFRDSMSKPEVLVAAADGALYAAKGSGRNCTRVWSPAIDTSNEPRGEAGTVQSSERGAEVA